jgi:hypothetical protein
VLLHPVEGVLDEGESATVAPNAAAEARISRRVDTALKF